MDVYVASDNVLSPLGSGSAENFLKLSQGISGIRKHYQQSLSPEPFVASLFENNEYALENSSNACHTKFEQLLIASIKDALSACSVKATDKRTLLVISSTKGNISMLESGSGKAELTKKVALHSSAKVVAEHFGFVNLPLVVSNACISGLVAILTGKRLIQSGIYDHAVVAGADVISRFVLSGFQSFQAISSEPCKPFDAGRNGITLGEGAGTIILSSHKDYANKIKVTGGSVSNDANHISGPSRTGEELYQSVKSAMDEAELRSGDVDFISAHGTATLYNDEMEAKAIHLGNMQTVPVNSLKGYYGHTLGAAGLIESVISVHSLMGNLLLPTRGFETLGVTQPINVCSRPQSHPLRNFLKTASGFGGCNAALIFSK